MVQTQKRTVSVCSFVNTLVENYFNLVYRKFSLGVLNIHGAEWVMANIMLFTNLLQCSVYVLLEVHRNLGNK